MIAAGAARISSWDSAQRQNLRIDEVLIEIDAGDFVAAVIRQGAQRLPQLAQPRRVDL